MNSQIEFSESGSSPPGLGGRSPFFMSLYFECLPPGKRAAYKAARRELVKATDAAHKKRKKIFRTERVQRERRGDTVARTWWHGEPRPEGYTRASYQDEKGVVTSTWFLQSDIESLALAGYPREAFAAMQTRGHLPCLALPSDKRRHGRYNQVGSGQSSATRRTTQGGGFTQKQVEDAIREFAFTGHMQYALLRVVHGRQSPKIVAAEYGLNLGSLKAYATKVRKLARRKAEFQRATYVVEELNRTENDIKPVGSAKVFTHRILSIQSIHPAGSGRFPTVRTLWLVNDL